MYEFNVLPKSAKNDKKFCDCIELEELSKIFIALTLGFRYATISPTIKVKWNASIGMEVRLKCYAVSLF